MPKLKTKGTIHETLTGYDFTVDEPLSRTKAIRAKCLECCSGNPAEVRRCHISDCALWPWRMGSASLRAQRAAKSGASETSDQSGGV